MTAPTTTMTWSRYDGRGAAAVQELAGALGPGAVDEQLVDPTGFRRTLTERIRFLEPGPASRLTVETMDGVLDIDSRQGVGEEAVSRLRALEGVHLSWSGTEGPRGHCRVVVELAMAGMPLTCESVPGWAHSRSAWRHGRATHGHQPDRDVLDELTRTSGIEVTCAEAPEQTPFGDVLLKMDDDWYGPDFVTDLLLARAHSGADVVGCPPGFILVEQLGLTVRRMRRYVDASLQQAVTAAGGVVHRAHGQGYVLRRASAGHTWDPGVGYFLSRARVADRWRGFRPSPVLVAAPWSRLHDQRRSPLLDPDRDLRMPRAELVGHSRVRMVEETAKTALRLPAGWSPGRDSVRRLCVEMARRDRGLVSLPMPGGRVARLERTPAFHRAMRLTSSGEDLDAVVDQVSKTWWHQAVEEGFPSHLDSGSPGPAPTEPLPRRAAGVRRRALRR